MKTTKTIFQDGNHKWVAIVRDPEKPNYLIDTNEYLVTYGGKGLLLDPGGAEIFPSVFSALSADFDPTALAGIFAFRAMKIQQFMDIDLPTVTVTATLPGAAPAQMETEVARKIENSVATLQGIKHILSLIHISEPTRPY